MRILPIIFALLLATSSHAAVVTRYFSTTSAGAGDGTTWADRAALFSAGSWSSVITGFSFAGSDSLQCLVGPGTYTCSQALSTSVITPTAANMIFIAGCDSSGNRLSPPDTAWTSNQGAFDDSSFPVIETTSNISTTTLQLCQWYCIKFSITARNGVGIGAGHYDWVSVANSTANTAAIGATPTSMSNSQISMTGSSYAAAMQYATVPLDNVLLVGVTGSSGNRYGLQNTGTNTLVSVTRITARGFGGAGVIGTSATASHMFAIKKSTIVGNGGDGVCFPSTASQTGVNIVEDCVITGNGGYGLNAQSAANVLLRHSRFRNNTSGDTNGMGNQPIDYDNYTTSATDSDEYVNTATGNYLIKMTAMIWGEGFGVADQVSTGGGVQTSTPFIR